MIKYFHDEPNDRYIFLGNRRCGDAIAYLVSLGIEGVVAAEHVEQSLKEYRRNGLSEERALALLVDSTWIDATKPRTLQFSQARNFLRNDIYDMISSSYPSNYPVSLISFHSYMDERNACLRISSQNAITLATLSQRLVGTSANHTVEIIFFDEDEETILAKLDSIFYKLGLLKTFENLTVDYSEAYRQCVAFAKRFCRDQLQNFPGGNFYIRNLRLRVVQPSLKEVLQEQQRVEAIEREASRVRPLFEAVLARDVRNVHQLLRSGIKADSVIRNYPIVASIFPRNDRKEQASGEDILNIFSLFLEYGAELDKGFYHGTALASIIYTMLNFGRENPKQFAILGRMILMTMLIDNGKTYSYTDANHHSPFVRMIAEGQREVINGRRLKRAILQSLPRSSVRYALQDGTYFAPIEMTYSLDRTIKLSITTMYLSDLLKDAGLIAILFDLFRKSPPWINKMSEKALQEYFFELMCNTHGQAYIDLIRSGDTVVGFNFAEFIPVSTETEELVFHYVKIALINAEFSGCKGLMFSVSHGRGFVPLENRSKVKVITVFEAASASSKFAIESFNHYPKEYGLQCFVPLLKKLIYNKDELVWDNSNMLWRIKDPLASFEKLGKSSFWKTRRMLATDRFFSEPIYRQGESILVMYENNPSNHVHFQTQLQTYLDKSQAPAAPNLAMAKL